MIDYSKLDYWEERYSECNLHDLFEWYQIYASMKEIISPYLNVEYKILNIGAGNSSKLFSKNLGFSEDMFRDGYTKITDVDFSPSIVSLMSERYKELNLPIQYKQLDVHDMKDFQDEEFNFIIDKGTLDSVLCGENAAVDIQKIINEIYRVLSANGTFICISYGQEESRKPYFMNKDWEYRKETVAKPNKMIITNVDAGDKDSKNFHHIYILTKKTK